MQITDFDKLFTDLNSISGVGLNNYPKYCRLLNKEKVRIIDLLWHFPNKIIHRKNIKKIEDVEPDEICTIKVTVTKYIPAIRKNLPHRFIVSDETGNIELLYFNIPNYMINSIKIGDEKYISGKVTYYKDKKQITHPDFILSNQNFNNRREFEPIYPLTNGLTNYNLLKTFENIFQILGEIPEWHDKSFLEKNNWNSFIETFKNIHLPECDFMNNKEINFYKRLAFDEILINQLKITQIRNLRKNSNGISNYTNTNLINELIKKLPFKISPSQLQAMKEIFHDMNKETQMIRLLHGDVGSGKTLISFMCGLMSIESGFQFALMAPTEILAKQHYKNFKLLTQGLDIKSSLLISNIESNHKKNILSQIKNGHIQAVIGTHALFQESIQYNKLGFVVVDEQHRFGIHQRLSLQEKSVSGVADFLLMTATPIPRTLIQTKYGDISVSKLANLPGKKAIHTSIISDKKIDNLVIRLKKIINNNNKVFWVCPQITENTKQNSSVLSRYRFLKKHFSNISMIHGKMDEVIKNNEIYNFLNHKTNILVATSIIEVGVDIKEANIIVIENANFFGLSQIHQLRGRVGRNKNKSWCILIHDNNLTDMAKERLSIIKNNQDGLKIAELDLKLRGYGDIIGNRQAGFSNFRVLNEDLINELNNLARDESEEILQRIITNEKDRKRYKMLFKAFDANEFKYLIG